LFDKQKKTGSMIILQQERKQKNERIDMLFFHILQVYAYSRFNGHLKDNFQLFCLDNVELVLDRELIDVLL